jgi:hypothetical protein
MPAVSKAQQRFMGMVHAVQKGDMEAPSKEVEKAADSMSDKAAKDFASTSHKGLPSKKEELTKEAIRNYIRESFKESVLTEDIKADVLKFIDKLNKEFTSHEYSTDFSGGKYARISHDSRQFPGNRSVWGFVAMIDNPGKGFKKGDLLKAAGWNTPAKNARGNVLDGTAKYTKWSPAYLK